MGAPIRLERETPGGGQAGCATSIGLFLTLLGGIIVLGMRSDAGSSSPNEWVIYVVGGGFLLVGIAVAILGLKMFVATRYPRRLWK